MIALGFLDKYFTFQLDVFIFFQVHERLLKIRVYVHRIMKDLTDLVRDKVKKRKKKRKRKSKKDKDENPDDPKVTILDWKKH